MTRNEGDYMLVAHKHKINFHKTTTIRVSTPFVDRIDPFIFVSFYDLTARNFDTPVAFDFIGQVVYTEPMRVIKENARETRLMNIVAQDLSIADIDLNVESSINTTQLNTQTVVAKPEDYYFHFHIKNIDDIPDYNDDQGRQKIPDEFNTMLNRKYVFKVQISKFNLENSYHAYTVHKMANDELAVGAVFKYSPAYEENNIHFDGTPINKSIKEKSVSIEGDNINVLDLDAVTPTTTSLKRPIEIVTTTESFEWSSSKDGVAPHTLKIQKMEKTRINLAVMII
ncbi:unnamed protein product [Lactuca virosa]|uniref:Uncharacterized protein n=1 Tax=Lactuca virosa TaxID=75947 RepID=A0AAU9NPQ2_9ASTR|nr:unnamed protein product [Lactuca virosa]